MKLAQFLCKIALCLAGVDLT